jgi:hypothetical protein
MSRPVHERLRELEYDVRELQVLPAAEVRARGRRRGRRQMSAVVVACAVVATTAGVGVAAAWERPDQRTAATGAAPTVSCVLDLPDSPADVHTRVLDGGAPAGLTDATASQLRARSFTVLASPVEGDPAATTTLYYGPAAIGAATLLRAVVHGDVQMRFDPDRRDDTVDLVLGPAFTRLATTIEINQSLVAAGEPSAPPQCTAVVPPTPTR